MDRLEPMLSVQSGPQQELEQPPDVDMASIASQESDLPSTDLDSSSDDSSTSENSRDDTDAMALIEMERIRKFPIKKLSYDLKLELLENMRPEDVIELINVSQEFRSIVLGEPWRIFGKHVDVVDILYSCLLHSRTIEKFESRWTTRDNECSVNSESSTHSLKLKSFLTLVSKIRSSQKFYVHLDYERPDQEATQLFAELLSNLDWVRELDILMKYINEDQYAKIEKYLTRLTLNHIEKATLTILKCQIDERRLGFLSNFVVTRFNRCKRIEIYYEWADFSFWYETFSKISTEMFLITLSAFEELVHLIVTQGIPGSNPEATILLRGQMKLGYVNDSIVDLVSRTPGIHRIVDEDRGEVGKILEKLNLDGLIPEHYTSDVDRLGLLQEGVYFMRSIDSKRKCIYATVPVEALFFAKYITI